MVHDNRSNLTIDGDEVPGNTEKHSHKDRPDSLSTNPVSRRALRRVEVTSSMSYKLLALTGATLQGRGSKGNSAGGRTHVARPGTCQ